MKKFLFLSIVTFIFAKEFSFSEIKKIYVSSYNYEYIKKYDEAIKVLIPLIKRYPNGYTLNLRLGYLFMLNRNFKNSIKYYQKAISLAPNSIEAKLGLNRVYLQMQKYSKALILSYEILKKDYYNYFANLYAITALIAQKKYKDALNLANKMLYIYPTDILFLEKLAIIYKKTNNKNLNKVLQSIEVLDPNNVLATQLKK